MQSSPTATTRWSSSAARTETPTHFRWLSSGIPSVRGMARTETPAPVAPTATTVFAPAGASA